MRTLLARMWLHVTNRMAPKCATMARRRTKRKDSVTVSDGEIDLDSPEIEATIRSVVEGAFSKALALTRLPKRQERTTTSTATDSEAEKGSVSDDDFNSEPQYRLEIVRMGLRLNQAKNVVSNGEVSNPRSNR